MDLAVSHATRVEAALPEDVLDIYQTMIRAHEEAATPYPAPDKIYCIQACLDLIAQGFVGVVIEGNREIVGCIMLDYARWPWTHPDNKAGYHLYNQHFWVEPSARKFGTARHLLEFAKSVAKRKELSIVLTFSNMAEKEADARDRFARINGFNYTGGTFYWSP